MTPPPARTVRRALLASLPAAALLSSFTTFAFAQGDPAVIKKIIDEGKNKSKVWVYETYLAEEIGTRLTGSSGLERANNWTRDLFESFGCTNAHLMQWGEIPVRFDRGPSYCKVTKPVERTLEFTTRSWSAGTDGPIKGKVVKQPTTMDELNAMKDELKGAWVLAKPLARGGRRGIVNDNNPPATPPGNTPGNSPAGAAAADTATGAPPAGGARENARDGAAAPAGGDGNAPPARRGGGAGGGGGGGNVGQNEELIKALYDAGIAGRIVASTSDLVITGGERNWRTMKFEDLPTQVSITISRKDYDAINSRLSDGESVELEADLNHRFSTGPDGGKVPLYNTVAEIPGTEFPEQVVIVSAHLDSWDGPGSQGAQDNGTGTSVTVETARILMAAGAKPRRTIRFVLWSGEEQGLLGSKGYLDSLSDEEKANISAVLVDDGGTNYQGGLVCVKEMEEMLTKATEPINAAFPDMKVDIIVRERMPRGGGSDHATFNAAGIPGFFWEEDGLGGREGKNYTYVHHTQFDTTRFAVPEYLVQSATCSAVTAYNLAMADTMLPRYVAPAATPEPETGPFTPTPGALTGTWTGSFIRDGQPSEFTFTYTIEHSSEGKMRGRMYSRFGDNAMKSIAFDSASGELSFKIDSDMGSSTYKCAVKGEDMNGTIQREEGSGTPMTFSAKRDTSDIKPPAAANSDASPRGGAGGGQSGDAGGN